MTPAPGTGAMRSRSGRLPGGRGGTFGVPMTSASRPTFPGTRRETSGHRFLVNNTAGTLRSPVVRPRRRQSTAEIPRVGRPLVTTVPTLGTLLARRRCHVSAVGQANPSTWSESRSQLATPAGMQPSQHVHASRRVGWVLGEVARTWGRRRAGSPCGSRPGRGPGAVMSVCNELRRSTSDRLRCVQARFRTGQRATGATSTTLRFHVVGTSDSTPHSIARRPGKPMVAVGCAARDAPPNLSRVGWATLT